MIFKSCKGGGGGLQPPSHPLHIPMAFQVNMNLIFMHHLNVVTSQFKCRTVQCGNAMQLLHSMNGPFITVD